VRLLGAAESLRELIGAPLPVPERTEYERTAALARSAVDDAAFSAAWNEGRSLTWEAAAAEALAEINPAV
jgi:hypothetical protein